VVNLLKQYEDSGILNTETNHKVEQRIMLRSPTISANPVFTSLKRLHDDDSYNNNSDSMLIEIIENIQYEKEQTIKYQEQLKLYKKFLKVKYVDDLTHQELIEL
jgi:hypothetical protein